MVAKSRSMDAASKMIEVAERLFAERGMHAVSLREIAQTAGQSNTFAVQYHFTDKNGLIKAIFEDRIAQIESRRRIRLGHQDEAGDTIYDLLDCLYRPIIEQVDRAGRRTYARFLRQVISDPLTYHYWTDVRHLAPAIAQGSRRIEKLCPDLSAEIMESRLKLVSVLVLHTIYEAEIEEAAESEFNRRFMDTLSMAATGLLARPKR